MSRLSWFLGRGEDADRYGDQAVATLEPLRPGHELAMAFSNKSQLAMLAGRVRRRSSWGDRAVELARSIGDRDVEATPSTTSARHCSSAATRSRASPGCTRASTSP